MFRRETNVASPARGVPPIYPPPLNCVIPPLNSRLCSSLSPAPVVADRQITVYTMKKDVATIWGRNGERRGEPLVERTRNVSGFTLCHRKVVTYLSTVSHISFFFLRCSALYMHRKLVFVRIQRDRVGCPYEGFDKNMFCPHVSLRVKKTRK